MQADLFNQSDHDGCQQLPMADADVRLCRAFLPAEDATHMLSVLTDTLCWREECIRLYGKVVKIPRLQAWYGEKHAIYSYSGLTMQPLPFTRELLELKQRCEQVCNTKFNSVLANLYRDQYDSMGWHADDEPELGRAPIIASLSLGEAREFKFRHKGTAKQCKVTLPHGSLLIMAGATQRFWQHSISKRVTPMAPRINLTFRHITPLER